jgi:signal transduction histidine kinase/CheY-like chemotaxis protein
VTTDDTDAGAGEDEALTWRNHVSLRILRAQFFVFLLGTVIVGLELTEGSGRHRLVAVALSATIATALPAFGGWPSGTARAWMAVVPGIGLSIAGYAIVGVLSGPGACLAVTLMLAGLLLRGRAMIGLIIASGCAVSAVGWAMVHGVLPPPVGHDVAMTSGTAWIRSLAVTFLALSLFGGLMIAVVSRIETALRLARSETRRRERAERAKAEAERAALESKQLEMIGRLAAGVAHDFNNSLTAIMGSAELLRQDLAGQPEGAELAESIVQASQHAAELTRQLLAYSRKAQMVLAPTDLHRVIEDAVTLLRRSIDPSVTVVTELAADNATVAADRALIESALLNLLVNARDAMPDGGTLTVSTSSVERASGDASEGPTGPCLLIEVSDTGLGIEPALLPSIFDPFFTTKPIGRGTGLGLAAVAGTIKAHGGLVEVDSVVGRGSCFRVCLPCTQPDLRGSRAGARAIVRGSGEILLVEDDAMVSHAASATLRSFGYEVTHVADGASALERVRANPGRFALVLLDLRMSGMSGEATFDALRAIDGSLKVLIWSGYGADQDVNAMLRRGAVGFVQKPYRVAELSRTIADVLRAQG